MRKIAIVTGATRGIGRATAELLTEKGFDVVGVYEKSDEKAKEFERINPHVKMLKANVGEEADVKKVFDFISHEYGRLDVVVNNAGIALMNPIVDVTLEDWNKLISVNLTGKFLFAKYAIPLLKKSTDGVIVNISSRGGLNEFVFSNFVSYCVSNAGINNFTVALAKELKPESIRVNAVIPTVTDTDRFKNAFTPEEQKEVDDAGKLGTPAEVAQLIWSLIEDKSKNGEILIDKRVFIETNA